MRYSKTFIFFLFIIVLSCSSESKTNEVAVKDSVALAGTIHTSESFTLSNKELEKSWRIFTNAVLSNNLREIKEISTACIHCTDCPTNTRQEDSLFSEYQKKNPNTWYDKLYSQFSYIPIDEFLTNDYPSVFDSVVKSRFYNQSAIRFYDVNEINMHLYSKNCIVNSSTIKESTITEIFVKTIDWSEETEGMSKVFSFLKTKDGYKFCGYWTLP
jgi:hypothetical protein